MNDTVRRLPHRDTLPIRPAATPLLQAQRDVLEMIVCDRPLAEILDALCRLVEQQTGRGTRVAIQRVGGPGLDAPAAPGPDAWSIPIVAADGRVLGTFSTSLAENREATPDERQLVEVLSRTAALAIERHVADQALKSSERRHRFLTGLDAAMQRLSDPTAVMTTAAFLLAEELSADRCAYAEIESERIFVITGEALRGTPSIVGRWDLAAFGPECVRCMLAGEAYVVCDVAADERILAEHRPAYLATTIEAVICVPLHKDGRFTAAMAVHQARPRHWTDEEVELVRVVVARCWETLERTRIARSLSHSEARYRTMIEASPECVKLVAADGTLLQMNAAGLRMLESSAEAIGRNLYPVIAPEHRTAFREFNERICRGDSGTLEFDVIGAGGTRRSMVTTAVPLATGDGGFMQLGMTRDVTRRVQADRALTESRERLTALNAELRDQDRRKDEFLATLAHELRNPLAPIRTGLELLRSPGLAADQGGHVREMMERQLGHLVRMVDDLLDISRVTLNKIALQRRRIDLHEVLQSALETTRPLIAEREHVLELDLPFVPLPLEADPTRLAQVFSNLLNNAARYTPTGGRIHIAARREPEGLVVEVSDDGLGIPAEMLPRIFDLFIQVRRGPHQGQGGLGLGLTLVRRLLEMHDGTVEARSPGLGHGSTFIVRLPLVE